MMDTPRVPLYDRLPEIYRTRDEEIVPAGQLRAFLGLIERAFGAIHADIEALYDDLFIETAADWAVPYIGDLLGTSPLAGDPWTIRADVAGAIPLRRRKGTLAAIELLTFNLTGWGVRCVELRENLAWHQHLNHQRPDNGGLPLAPLPDIGAPVRGGTVNLRNPAHLGLLGTPFDTFAHLPDAKPPTGSVIRYNVPNLAIFLWRLQPYRIPVSRPGRATVQAIAGAAGSDAAFVVRAEIHPLERPVRLFNVEHHQATRRLDATDAISLTQPDEAPGPIHTVRLTDDTPAGNPAAYVAVQIWDPGAGMSSVQQGSAALQLHLPTPAFVAEGWQFRGVNLCAWEEGLDRPLENREIAIDPVIGRLAIGLATQAEADAIAAHLLLTYTCGAVGPVGAHPVPREDAPREWTGEAFQTRHVPKDGSLQDALANLDQITQPLVIEIADSLVHDLDLAAVAGVVTEGGEPTLALGRTVIVRGASGMRPIVRLAQPMRVRPARVRGATPTEQETIDGEVAAMTLGLEGLHIVRGTGFPADSPLVARVALYCLELSGCTLDPGGYRQRDGSRAPLLPAIVLGGGFGFDDPANETAFRETPAIRIDHSITGALLIDPDYTIELDDTIVDAGGDITNDTGTTFAIAGATNPATTWGAPLTFAGITVFGRVRVETVEGEGGIFVQPVMAHNNQTGCVKFSYAPATGNRLPQNHACVDGGEARLRFTSTWFADPGYGQVTLSSDIRIRERGPGDDQMGAFGFLLESHKWRNLRIRYREFMPLGVCPLLIPVAQGG